MKPVEKRLEETINIRHQMRKHGIDTDPGVAKLKEDMNAFVRHGEEQTGTSTLSFGPEIFWHFSNTQTSHVHVMKPKQPSPNDPVLT
jgi:hypothetical protein